MLIKYIIILCFSMWFALPTFAHDNILAEELLEVAKENLIIDPKFSLSKLDLLDTLYADYDSIDKFTVKRLIALGLMETGDFKKSIEVAEKLCSSKEKLTLKFYIECDLLKGRILERGQNYLRAEDFYNRASLQIAELNDPVLSNRLNYYLSDLTRNRNEKEKALVFADLVLSNDASTAYFEEALLSKGKTLIKMAQWSQAVKLFETYLANREQSLVTKIYLLSYLGISKAVVNNFARTVPISNEINHLSKGITSFRVRAEILSNKGLMLMYSGHLLDSHRVLLEALDVAKKSNNFKLIYRVYINLSMVHENMGQYKESYKYLLNLKLISGYQVDTSFSDELLIMGNRNISENTRKPVSNSGEYFNLLYISVILVLLMLSISLYFFRGQKKVSGEIQKKEMDQSSQLFKELTEAKRELKLVETSISENQQLLVRQSKMSSIGEMLAIILHQWKQPLAAIQLIAQGIKLNLEDAGDIEKDMVAKENDKILMQAESMVKILYDFSRFFKPTDGNLKFCPFEEVLSAIKMVKHQLQKDNIILELDLSEKGNDAFVEGNANEFKQVLINLIINAKDAVNSVKVEGKVIVSLEVKDKNLLIYLIDNGCGIIEDQKKYIFDSWFTTKEDKGSGIGLYISKLIIENRLYGSLSVDSDGQGKGCKFSIVLPICKK